MLIADSIVPQLLTSNAQNIYLIARKGQGRKENVKHILKQICDVTSGKMDFFFVLNF